MAYTEHYFTQFEAGCFYHVYNRSVDKKPMFKDSGNYEFFLRKYDQYLSDVVNTYAYCLLGNHFHLLVRIQDLTTFEKLSNLEHAANATNAKTPHNIVSHQFQKFFQSYAMAFNKQQDRIGTLFQTPFKRAFVDSFQYYKQMIYYIHANPQMHGLIKDFRDWKWSSYNRFLIDSVTKLRKQEVLDWFGSKDEYVKYHSDKQNIDNNESYYIDDL